MNKRKNNNTEQQMCSSNRKDAEKALETEKSYCIFKGDKCVRITFPDEEISISLVLSFHSDIKFVQFPVPTVPRHCFAILNEETDVDKTIKELSSVSFGNSFLKAELQVMDNMLEESVDNIDPYHLYVGNLPLHITREMLEFEFPDSKRIDIGFSHKCGKTRYAFVSFDNVDDAIRSYIEKSNLTFQDKTAVIRFRRLKIPSKRREDSESRRPSVGEVLSKKRKKKNTERRSANRSYLWNRQDAERALETERRYTTRTGGNRVQITFPDEEINSSIVRSFHPDIKLAQFRTSFASRYCFVVLKENADVDEIVNKLNKVPFGKSFLKAKLEVADCKLEESAENIDPYQLYVAKLPLDITSEMLKKEFPNSEHINIGVLYKRNATSRYAFVKFAKVDDAIQSYIEKLNLTLQGKVIVMGFRRIKASIHPPGSNKPRENTVDEGAAVIPSEFTKEELNELFDDNFPTMDLDKETAVIPSKFTKEELNEVFDDHYSLSDPDEVNRNTKYDPGFDSDVNNDSIFDSD